MQTFAQILRVVRDAGLILLVAVVLWKVFTEDGDEASPSASGPAMAHAAATLERRTNSIGMPLVRLPAGTFTMGSTAGSRETPAHDVRFARGFWIGQREVTQAEYRAVMESSPSALAGDDLPVERVSWHDAAEFCRRLGERELRAYRLPTEAEWEYACRAGSRSAFCFGDDDSRLGEFAWYDASAGHHPRPVASRKPNAWGLHDFHGNVWEWCSDWYQPEAYASAPPEDPRGPAEGTFRVLRGGCWYNRPVFCRSARRDFGQPGQREDSIGFRVVLELEPGTADPVPPAR